MFKNWKKNAITLAVTLAMCTTMVEPIGAAAVVTVGTEKEVTYEHDQQVKTDHFIDVSYGDFESFAKEHKNELAALNKKESPVITTANLTGAVSALTNALKTTHNAGDFIMAFTSKLPVVGPWLDLGYTILGLNAPQPQGPSYEDTMIDLVSGITEQLTQMNQTLCSIEGTLQEQYQFAVTSDTNSYLQQQNQKLMNLTDQQNSAMSWWKNILDDMNSPKVPKYLNKIIADDAFTTKNSILDSNFYHNFEAFSKELLGNGSTFLFPYISNANSLRGKNVVEQYETILRLSDHMLNTETIQQRKDFVINLKGWYTGVYTTIKATLEYKRLFNPNEHCFEDKLQEANHLFNEVNLMLNKELAKIEVEENSDIVWNWKDKNCYYNKDLKVIKPFKDAYDNYFDLTSSQLSTYMVSDYNAVVEDFWKSGKRKYYEYTYKYSGTNCNYDKMLNMDKFKEDGAEGGYALKNTVDVNKLVDDYNGEATKLLEKNFTIDGKKIENIKKYNGIYMSGKYTFESCVKKCSGYGYDFSRTVQMKDFNKNTKSIKDCKGIYLEIASNAKSAQGSDAEHFKNYKGKLKQNVFWDSTSDPDVNMQMLLVEAAAPEAVKAFKDAMDAIDRITIKDIKRYIDPQNEITERFDSNDVESACKGIQAVYEIMCANEAIRNYHLDEAYTAYEDVVNTMKAIIERIQIVLDEETDS